MTASIEDNEQARERLRLLANGADPDTGEMLPGGHVCQQADTVRALFRALAALDRVIAMDRARERSRLTLPANTGKGWNLADDQRLLAAYQAGTSIEMLAVTFARTDGAIRSRLQKLGALPPHHDGVHRKEGARPWRS